MHMAHAGGRPSNYKDEYCKQAEQLARLGATDKEMASFFGVTEQTINNWKKNKPEFFESLKKGKILADARVSEALYEKTQDHTFMVAKTIKVKSSGYDDNGRKWEKEEIKQVEEEQFVSADTTAQIFWLKNRRSRDWRDKQDVQVTGGVNIVYADRDDKEL